MLRRRFEQAQSLEARLSEEAKRLRAEAKLLVVIFASHGLRLPRKGC